MALSSSGQSTLQRVLMTDMQETQRAAIVKHTAQALRSQVLIMLPHFTGPPVPKRQGCTRHPRLVAWYYYYMIYSILDRGGGVSSTQAGEYLTQLLGWYNQPVSPCKACYNNTASQPFPAYATAGTPTALLPTTSTGRPITFIPDASECVSTSPN